MVMMGARRAAGLPRSRVPAARRPPGNVLAGRSDLKFQLQGLRPWCLAQLLEALKQQKKLRTTKNSCASCPERVEDLRRCGQRAGSLAEREGLGRKSNEFHPVRLDCKLRRKATAGADVDTDKT